jgi:hypothetical protein
MSPRFRKLLLTVHVASAIGWFGSLAAFIALAVTGRASGDPELVKACYLAMRVTMVYVLVPFGSIALATGVLQAMLTQWGLVRHYWVLLKLILTSIATLLLIEHVTPVDILSKAASSGTLSAQSWLRVQIIAYACGGLVFVSTAMTLAVFRPRGMTRWSSAARLARRAGQSPTAPVSVRYEKARPTDTA